MVSSSDLILEGARQRFPPFGEGLKGCVSAILMFFLLFFASCSSLGTAFDTGVLEGNSAIKDKSRISLDTVGFSGSRILAVDGVPGKHAFLLVRRTPSWLLAEVEGLGVRTAHM